MLEDDTIEVGREFVALCEAQLNLLAHNFSVQESAIYLTETDNNQEPKLVPILIYPPPSTNSEPSFLLSLPAKSSSSELDSHLEQPLEAQAIINRSSNSQSPHQLLLPLVYEDTIMGLLAANRWHKQWSQNEVLQVKEIAQTIALARILEEKQQFTQQQLHRHQQLQTLEDEHLHDFLHQLRNPLTALRTFAKLLLKRLLSDDPNFKITENIIREGDRLKDLIQDFSEDWERINKNLDLTFSESNSTSFFLSDSIKKLERTDVKQLIESLIGGIKAIAKEKDIELISAIENDLPLAYTNQKALIEVLNNLLDNSIKYTPEGGKIAIEVRIKKSIENKGENKLIIEISDTGYGIPYPDQQHIFERNYRGVQEQGDISGTGLGLAIVKDLCEQVQIDIDLFSPSFWLKNQQLNGTTFILSIPIFAANHIN